MKATKATVEIDHAIMQRLLDEAKRRGTTVSALVEAGIWRILGEKAPTAKADGPLPDLPTWNSGGELVDITNRDELYRVMDEYDGFRY